MAFNDGLQVANKNERYIIILYNTLSHSSLKKVTVITEITSNNKKMIRSFNKLYYFVQILVV